MKICTECGTTMTVQARKDITDPNKVTLPCIAWCPKCGNWYHCQNHD